MIKHFCSIVTPTYNRAEFLIELHKSLCKQTKLTFEWIIIDDGSSDNTNEIVQGLKKQTQSFEIFYYYQENGGKHRAINFALDKARGEYFFIVDSDDFLPEKSIEIILNKFSAISIENKFIGVGGLLGYKDSHDLTGQTFNGEFVDCTSDQRNEFDIQGDKAEVYYTTIIKEYKFPEFAGEKFVSEIVLWHQIAKDGWKIRWFNEVVYLCEYLNDGLTKNIYNHLINSPFGWEAYIKTLDEMTELNYLKKAYYCAYLFNETQYRPFEEFIINFSLGYMQYCLGYILYKIKKNARN